MRRSSFFLCFFISLCLAGTQMANAATYGLNAFIVNDNGNVTFGGNPVTDGNLNLSGYDQTGEPGNNTLGSIVITLNASLSAQAVAFYADYDVDFQAAVGGGSFNDIGSTNGVAVAGLTYALTDFNAPDCTGDSAYCDVQNVPFTGFGDVNNDATPAGGTSPNAFDVDWGLGLTNIIAPLGGTITFTVSSTAPSGVFYIQQTNDQTNDSLYVSLTEDILSSGPPPPGVPEPSYLWAVGLCLPLFALWCRRKRAA